MKLKIGDYEVEISVRYEYHSQANDTDAMALLNKISIWAREAAKAEAAEGYPVTAKHSREAADNIFDELASRGYYKLLQTFAKEGVGDVEMP